MCDTSSPPSPSTSLPLLIPLLNPTPGGGRWSPLAAPLKYLTTPLMLILATCLVSYLNCLTCGFVFDDITAIKENKDIRHSFPFEKQFYDFLLNDFWGIPMHKEQSHKSYRPLTVLTYRINYLLHGLSPLGYHLGNLLLHLLVSLLYFSTLAANLDYRTALISSLLFTVHPIHTEAVTGVVGRAELLSSVFFLLAILRYTQKPNKDSKLEECNVNSLIQTSFLSALAMVSKEQGITVLGFCFVYELVFVKRFHQMALKQLTSKNLKEWSSLARVFFIALTAFLLLTFRIKLMQGSSLPVFTKFDNPASASVGLPRYLTYLALPGYNLGLLLCPASLCCDWTMGSIPLVTDISDVRNLLTMCVAAYLLHALVNLLKAEGGEALGLLLSLSLIVIPFLPASNIFFPVGFVLAERVLYIPSMGFCLLVSIGLLKLYDQCNNSTVQGLLKTLYVYLLLTHWAKTYSRNNDWKSEESIFVSGLKVNKLNAKLFNNVGHALESEKRHNESLVLFQQAVLVQPDDIGAHINIGRALNHLGRFAEAEVAYKTAKSLLPRAKPGEKLVTRIAPNSLNLFLNLGNLISKNSSRLEEADRLYRQAIAMRSDYIQAYINRGDVLIKMNKTNEAIQVYKEALKHDPFNPDLFYNLGVVAIEQKHSEIGLQYMNTALQYNPAHPEALLNSAILIQEMNRVELHQVALDRLVSLTTLQPDNEKAFFNLGMITMDEGWTWESEYWFKRAIDILPNFRGALFNLALLLTDQHRPLEAVPYLQDLLHHYPNHVKGLILLGDIYTNIIKDLDRAEEAYRKIVEVEPEHVQAHHNLCVVEVERGNLESAETCFAAVSKMAPTEQYIKKHLRIIRNKIKNKNVKKP